MSAARRICVLTALAVGGCVVGPDYKRPEVTLPAGFRGPAPSGKSGQTTQPADLPFWEMFQDPLLVALIREALGKNDGLLAAAERVEQARALAGLGTTALLPSVTVQAGPSYQQTFSPIRIADAVNPRYPLYQLQGLLSWELDLWGRLRRLRQAALADYLASEQARRGVVVALVGDVAQGYFQLLALDLQLRIARRTVESRRETLRLFEELARGGVGNRLQTASAEANLASAPATIPDLERQIAQREYQLALLLGRPPGPIARAADLLGVPAPPSLPPGLPAALLERRSDLRQAEAGLVAANAQVGAVFAEFLPRLSLTASAGLTSTELPSLFTAGAATCRPSRTCFRPSCSSRRSSARSSSRRRSCTAPSAAAGRSRLRLLPTVHGAPGSVSLPGKFLVPFSLAGLPSQITLWSTRALLCRSIAE
jgi:multidrug efflux system outer membrane protein